MPETMKLLGSTKSKKNKDKNSKNVLHLETIEVILVNCNIINNNYQHNLRVLYVFIPNKLFGQLLDISPQKFLLLKTFNSEFSYIEVLFIDQNSKPLGVEDKININLVINQSVRYKK